MPGNSGSDGQPALVNLDSSASRAAAGCCTRAWRSAVRSRTHEQINPISPANCDVLTAALGSTGKQTPKTCGTPECTLSQGRVAAVAYAGCQSRPEQTSQAG